MDAVLNALSYVGWVLLAIMILVFVHELGHFLLAKFFGMRVHKFSVGFPPRVLGKTIGDTEYVIGLTPLGGYVKIAGMVDESMDAEFEESEPQPWEFRSKPVWQRTLVIIAGVVFNMVLAAAVFISLKGLYGEAYFPAEGAVQVVDGSVAHQMGLRSGDELLAINGRDFDGNRGISGLEQMLLSTPFTLTVKRDSATVDLTGPADIITQLSRAEGAFGVSYEPTIVGDINPELPASKTGLRSGDRLIALNGKPINYWSELVEEVVRGDGSPVSVRWKRPDSLAAVIPVGAVPVAGARLEYEQTITPAPVADHFEIGIKQFVQIRTYSAWDAVGAGLGQTWTSTRIIFTSLKRVFTGQENFRENVGGPIMIARVTKEAADEGAPFFWNIVAMLSITLAIINILPIPALDGGHLMFLIYEGITRREPSLKVRMVMQQIGMFVLLAFMTFVIFNDILKL